MVDNYFDQMSENCTRIIYEMSKHDLFIAYALELTDTNIVLDTNKSFILKDFTFAYYDYLNNSIHINIDDNFFKNVNSNIDRISRLFLVLFHEINHKMLMHKIRGKDNDPELWNIAGDYEIHNMLYLNNELFNKSTSMLATYVHNAMNILTNPVNKKYEFCYSSKYLDNIAEEIYNMIKNSCKVSSKSILINIDNNHNLVDNNESNNNSKNNKQQNNDVITVKKTKYKLPNGKTHEVISFNWDEFNAIDEKSNENKQLNKNNADLRKQLLENNIRAAVEKNKGNISSSSSSFLKKLFKVKLDWEKILKNSLNTILQKADEFSWAKTRISTFAMDLPTLPGIDNSESGKGTLIIARDESGSMSDEDIRKAASIIIDAKEYYKKIIILKHDTKIVEITEFDEINDNIINMLLTRAATGGTSHQCVFKYLKNYYEKYQYNDDEKISCFISITDGMSDIQHYQHIVPSNIPMVYITPSNCIHYFNNVNGQIIGVE